MEINYDYYRIFYYVAKYKSFTQAAHVLLNNQPNITRSMNNLENQLGCQLFVRSNRGVELTPEGERLFSHVSIAYRQLQAAEMELGQNRELQSGSVSVGVSSSAFHASSPCPSQGSDCSNAAAVSAAPCNSSVRQSRWWRYRDISITGSNVRKLPIIKSGKWASTTSCTNQKRSSHSAPNSTGQ